MKCNASRILPVNSYMKVSQTITKFRIDIDFEDSDVDVVYSEARARGYSGPVPHILVEETAHKVKGSKTPTSNSVDFCLAIISGNANSSTGEGSRYCHWKMKEFENIGVEVESTCGLLMGTCHIEFETTSDKFTPNLVKKVEQIVSNVFKKHVRYHKEGRKLTT